jgi:hypothetical protein
MAKKPKGSSSPPAMSDLTKNLIAFGSLIVACRVAQALVAAATTKSK